MSNIIQYLENLMHYDWEAFNNLPDATIQAQIYQQLINGFKAAFVAETAAGSINYELGNALLNTYKEKFRNLPFMGKNYTFVNPYLICGQLRNVILELQMENEKTQNDHPICECALRDIHRQPPQENYLTKIFNSYNGYYHYDIYLCKECDFKWTAFTADDSTGRTIWEKYDAKMHGRC